MFLRDVEEDANSIDGLLSELRESTVVPLLLNPFQVLLITIQCTLSQGFEDVSILNILA